MHIQLFQYPNVFSTLLSACYFFLGTPLSVGDQRHGKTLKGVTNIEALGLGFGYSVLGI